MNISKKTGIGVGSILLVCAAAYAISAFQGNRAEDASAAKQVAARQKMGGPQFSPQQMLADLNLTEEQKQKYLTKHLPLRPDSASVKGGSTIFLLDTFQVRFSLRHPHA